MENARWPVGFMVLAILGCGDEDPPAGPPVDSGACLQAIQPYWQSSNPSPGHPRRLQWHDGTLYALSASPPSVARGSYQIHAIEAGGAPSRVIAEEVWITDFWLEGGTLLYANSDVLRAVPLAGGAPVTLVDGQTNALTRSSVSDFQATVDADHFYWTAIVTTLSMGVASPSLVGWSAWRAPRAGGAVQTLATFQREEWTLTPRGFGRPAALMLAGENLVAADETGNGWAVPRAGGTPIQFAQRAGDAFMGADAAGILWLRHASMTEVLVRSSFSGTMPQEPLWPGQPAGSSPSRAWSDGQGGWFLGLREALFGERRETLWHLPASGQASRVACFADPDEVFGEAVGVTPDAIYVVTGPATGWGIGRVAR